MPIAPSNGIELYYETHGDPADPALVLVNGYTSQIGQWGEGFARDWRHEAGSS